MSQWFYAEGNSERRGPVAADDLLALFRDGRISTDTLVWREGAAGRQPLRDFASELVLPGLQPLAIPAAMPPLPPPLQGHAPAQLTQARKPANSGWVVVGVIAAVIGLAVLTIGGLLAAIAFPAYQQYVLRSQITAVEAQLLPLKIQVAQFVADNARCPSNRDEGFDSPDSYAGEGISQVYFGDFVGGHCGLEARLHMPDKKMLDGKSIWLDYDTQSATWRCTSDVADEHLPYGCRG